MNYNIPVSLNQFDNLSIWNDKKFPNRLNLKLKGSTQVYLLPISKVCHFKINFCVINGRCNVSILFEVTCIKWKTFLKDTIKKGLNQKVNLGYWNLSCQKKLSKVDATAVVDAQCDRSVVCSAWFK